MRSEESKTYKHNLIFNLLDGASFGFGFGFASFSTVLPLFVSTMTSSALLIGLIPAIHNVGWQFPQLLTANHINRMERTKPYVMGMTTNERLPYLFIGIIALLLPTIGYKWGLILTFLCLVWQGIGAGLTANAWQILISKVIPADSLATFLGSQSALSNLLSSASAVLAGIVLEKVAAPYGFAICLIIAFLAYVVSWLFLNQTVEAPRIITPDTQKQPSIWKNITHILKTDAIFRNFLFGRFLWQFGMMAFAFYTVFAVKQIGMTTITVGIMTSVLMITQTIANPVLGWLADHWSRKWVLVIGGLCTVLSATFAAIIKEPGWFVVVFILAGIANVAFWTIGMSLALEFGNDTEKPVYVGMSNTLIAPATILAPLFGGLLADSFSYMTTFHVSIIFGLITLALLTFFVKDPKAIIKNPSVSN